MKQAMVAIVVVAGISITSAWGRGGHSGGARGGHEGVRSHQGDGPNRQGGNRVEHHANAPTANRANVNRTTLNRTVVYQNRTYNAVILRPGIGFYRHPHWIGGFRCWGCWRASFVVAIGPYPWAWYGDPWWPYYSYYWRPRRVYAYPREYIADYVAADTFYDGYRQGYIDAKSTHATQLNDDQKKQQEQQVDAELSARADSTNKTRSVPIEAKLADPKYAFMVSDLVQVSYDQGDEHKGGCTLSQGDLVTVAPGADVNAPKIPSIVDNAKSTSCAAGAKVDLTLDQLTAFDKAYNDRIDQSVQKMKDDPNFKGKINEAP